jgi:hypothetical protein
MNANFISLQCLEKFKFFIVYLDDRDTKIIREGVKIAIAMSQTNAFQRLNSRLNPNLMPGCKHLTPFSDEYWECAIR